MLVLRAMIDGDMVTETLQKKLPMELSATWLYGFVPPDGMVAGASACQLDQRPWKTCR